MRPSPVLLTPLLLALAVPAAAQDDDQGPAYRDAARCGVLNSLMGVLEEGDAEKSRAREAMALTWFSLASEDASLDEAAQKAAFDAVHEEEGEAVVAQPAEGNARADHMLTRLKACDALKKAHFDAWRDMAELLAVAAPDKFADGAAMGRQGKEPPPIPRKDLSFADGWTFQSRGNSCTAYRMLNKDVELRFGFSNFSDGVIWVTGSKLPPIPEDKVDAMVAKYDRGAVDAEDEEGTPIDRFAPGISYANYPGTALFVDGALVGRITYGATEEGETAYRLGHLQSLMWPKIKAGKELRVKISGKEAGLVQLGAAGGLWAEMQTCIDQYPDG